MFDKSSDREGADVSRSTVFLQWLQARLSEATSCLGIAAFFASTGTALAGAGFQRSGLVVGAIGTGCGGVGAFITKEKGAS